MSNLLRQGSLQEASVPPLAVKATEALRLGDFKQAIELFKRLVNLGDAKSLACHPASTTHRQMSPEEQRKAGVSPEMIRLSIGIEHCDDIIADLDQALGSAIGITGQHCGRDHDLGSSGDT